MVQRSREPGLPGEPLLRCPQCASRLIHTTDAAGYDRDVIVSRRCPDCQHRDSIVTAAPVAAALQRRDHRIHARLVAVADALEQPSTPHTGTGLWG
jgi:hypothetical protein